MAARPDKHQCAILATIHVKRTSQALHFFIDSSLLYGGTKNKISPNFERQGGEFGLLVWEKKQKQNPASLPSITIQATGRKRE